MAAGDPGYGQGELGGWNLKICVICEGCYPFVAGGVSGWLHGLIRAMPQHEFVIWAIGASEKSRGHFAYEMPPNVTALYDLYLDEMMSCHIKRPGRRTVTQSQKECLRSLIRCEKPDWDTVFRLFSQSPMENVRFLMSRDFLDLIEELSAEDFPYVGFTEYFYCVRSMFLPLLYLLGSEIPEADL